MDEQFKDPTNPNSGLGPEETHFIGEDSEIIDLNPAPSQNNLLVNIEDYQRLVEQNIELSEEIAKLKKDKAKVEKKHEEAVILLEEEREGRKEEVDKNTKTRNQEFDEKEKEYKTEIAELSKKAAKLDVYEKTPGTPIAKWHSWRRKAIFTAGILGLSIAGWTISAYQGWFNPERADYLKLQKNSESLQQRLTGQQQENKDLLSKLANQTTPINQNQQETSIKQTALEEITNQLYDLPKNIAEQKFGLKTAIDYTHLIISENYVLWNNQNKIIQVSAREKPTKPIYIPELDIKLQPDDKRIIIDKGLFAHIKQMQKPILQRYIERK